MSDKMKQWQKNAKDTYKDLKDLDPDKATKNQFILYAACVALHGHMDYNSETVTSDSMPTIESHAEPPQTIDYVPHSRVDELIQEMLLHFTSYMQNKSLEQLHRSEPHGAIACDSLRKMLAVNEEIAMDLFRAGDSEERGLIQESYKRVVKSIV